MIAFESDSDAWFAEHLSARHEEIRTPALLAFAIPDTAKSIYYWEFVASTGGCS
jgi:hypothetical protein